MGFVYGFVKPWFDFVANLQIETVDGSGGLEQKIPVDFTGGLSRSQVDSRWVKATSGISTVFLSSLFFLLINIFNIQEIIVESLESPESNMETMLSSHPLTHLFQLTAVLVQLNF